MVPATAEQDHTYDQMSIKVKANTLTMGTNNVLVKTRSNSNPTPIEDPMRTENVWIYSYGKKKMGTLKRILSALPGVHVDHLTGTGSVLQKPIENTIGFMRMKGEKTENGTEVKYLFSRKAYTKTDRSNIITSAGYGYKRKELIFTELANKLFTDHNVNSQRFLSKDGSGVETAWGLLEKTAQQIGAHGQYERWKIVERGNVYTSTIAYVHNLRVIETLKNVKRKIPSSSK
jgi:hypothetical protein